MGAAEALYLLCAGTSLIAAWMLMRYYHVSRTPLLLWSCIGFVGLAANNVLVVLDLVLFREVDLSLVRTQIQQARQANLRVERRLHASTAVHRLLMLRRDLQNSHRTA